MAGEKGVIRCPVTVAVGEETSAQCRRVLQVCCARGVGGDYRGEGEEGMRVVVVDGAVNPIRAGLPVLIAGRYLVGPLLGRGGAAEVYRAHDQVLDRAVAVKLFLSGVTTTDPRRQHREVTTLAGLSHPGLVTVYNAVEMGKTCAVFSSRRAG